MRVMFLSLVDEVQTVTWALGEVSRILRALRPHSADVHFAVCPAEFYEEPWPPRVYIAVDCFTNLDVEFLRKMANVHWESLSPNMGSFWARIDFFPMPDEVIQLRRGEPPASAAITIPF